MQDRELEDLALDLKELLFLLREAGNRKELLPVAERHINRLIKTLAELRDSMNVPKADVPVKDDEPVAALEIIEQAIAVHEEQAEQAEETEIPKTIASPATVLGEQLKPAAELSKGLTLNETFRFSRELFNGDTDEMNRVLQEISRMSSFADAVAYLSSRIEWDEENDAVKDFGELLKKYIV